MDSSTPTTPISHCSKPRILKSPMQTPPSIRKSPVTMQELLSMSPPPYRKSRSRPRPIIVEDCIDSMAMVTTAAATPTNNNRRKGRSPRNARKARRRTEKENHVREAKELVNFDDGGDLIGRVRKRRQSKMKVDDCSKESSALALVDSVSTASLEPPKIEDEESHFIIHGLWELILDLTMWKDVAKSSLWFGLGTLFFMSSCLSRDVSFSMISVVSHLGLLILGLSFLYDSFTPRQIQRQGEPKFKLTEEDVLRISRLILPITNIFLTKSQDIFSGEPLMTLKVAPALLFAAKYGHLITVWRFLAVGFFLSFTLPKLYSCYCDYIHKRVGDITVQVIEAWKSCPRKKIVVTTTAIMLWNLFSLKMRIFAGFLAVVVLRCNRQHIGDRSAEDEANKAVEKES